MIRFKVTLVAICAAAACVCDVVGVVDATAAPKGWAWEECFHNPAINHTATEYTDVTCGTTGAGEFFWTPMQTSGRMKDTSAGAKTSLTTTVAGNALAFECSEHSGEGEVEEATLEEAPIIRVTGLQISFKSCTVTTPSTCAISGGGFTTNALKVETIPGTMSTRYAPASGTVLATVTLVKGTGACAIAGSYKLSGTLTASVNEELAVDEFTSTSGSVLNFGSQAATFLAKSKWCTPGNGRGARKVTA